MVNPFKRWYVQDSITKINPLVTEQILKDKSTASTGAVVELSTKDRTVLITISGEIYHCNIKLPLKKVEEMWASATQQGYAGEAGIPTYYGLSTNPDSPGVGSSTFYDQYQASIGEEFGKPVPRPGGFYEFMVNEIFKNFVSFQKDKIKKVGQYLEGDTSLKLDALDRPLNPGGLEGPLLLKTIKEESEIFVTGRYYMQGKAPNALFHFQALLFLPGDKAPNNTDLTYGPRVNVVNGPIPGVAGVTPLALEELRQIACKPVKQKKRKKKPDDPNAEKNIEKGKKTQREVDRKKLTKKQKRDVAKEIEKRINQVTDAAFLNALIKAKDIKTRKEVFDFCLNVLPLKSMLEIAIECAKKFINLAPDVIVCDIIMRNLSSDDIQKILAYVNVNITADSVAQAFKADIIDAFASNVDDDPEGFRNFLIDQFNNNVSNKTIICAMVFLALPAAITLLALYIKRDVKGNVTEDGTCGDPLSPAEIQTISRLENPFKSIYKKIETSIKNHPILSYTKKMPEILLDQMILIVNQILVDGVALMLQELALLCEGSSKSDLANALPSAPLYTPDINDYIEDQGAYDGLLDALNLQKDELGEEEDLALTKDLIKDFFSDIGEFLTLSELCVLFAGTKTIGDLNYDIALDKVFYGLLALDKYAPIAAVLDTRAKLSDFLDEFSDSFDQALCLEKIEELTKAKKLLSDLCDSSNQAYAEELKQTLTEDAVCSLLEQESDILDNLFDAIKNLVEPELPEVFCGPEAERLGKTPLFGTFQDDSQMHLARKHLQSILNAAGKTFESEVEGFKTIMSSNQFISGILQSADGVPAAAKTILSLGTGVTKTMGQIYELREGTKNKMPKGSREETQDLLNSLSANYKFVAADVQAVLTGLWAGGNLITSTTTFNINSDGITSALDEPFTQNSLQSGNGNNNSATGVIYEISTAATNGHQIRYFVNYSSVAYNLQNLGGLGLNQDEELRSYTSRLINIRDGVQISSYDRALPLSVRSTSQQIDNNKNALQFTNIFKATNNKEAAKIIPNTEPNSSFKSFIEEIVYSQEFFVDILERIISEHAEFVSTSDLFKKSEFSKLLFSKKNSCDPSLLQLFDIVDKLEYRAKYIECKIGFTVPTPSEVAHMASLYEATIRILTVTELMKSVFVFASLGMTNLMKAPIIEQLDPLEQTTFYFEYVSSVIESKINNMTPDGSEESLQQAIIYIVQADLKNQISQALESGKPVRKWLKDIGDNLDDYVDYSYAIKYLVRTAVLKTQNIISSKLNRAGFANKLLPTGVLEEELTSALNQGLSNADDMIEIISNLVPQEKNLAILSPPNVVKIDFEKKETIVPAGTYSQNPRLTNGGFFIERGFEVIHNRQSTPTKVKGALTSDRLMLLFDMLTTWTPTAEDFEIITPPGVIEQGNGLPDLILAENFWTPYFTVDSPGLHLGNGVGATSSKIYVGDVITNWKLIEQFGNMSGPYLDSPVGQTNLFNFVGVPKINGEDKFVSSVKTVPLFESIQGYDASLQLTMQRTMLGGESPVEGIQEGTPIQPKPTGQHIISAYSTFWNNQTANIDFLKQSTDFTLRQGRISIEQAKSNNPKFGFASAFDARDLFAQELRKGIKYARGNGVNTFVPMRKFLYPDKDPSFAVYGAGDTTKEHEFLLNEMESFFKTNSNYFDRFGEYETLNLLIRLPSNQDGTINPEDPEFYKSLSSLKTEMEQGLPFSVENSFQFSKNPIGEQIEDATRNNQAFLQTVFERKYFIREEGENGFLYFKLPIIYNRKKDFNTKQDFLSMQTNDQVSIQYTLSSLVQVSETLEAVLTQLAGEEAVEAAVDAAAGQVDILTAGLPTDGAYPSDVYGYTTEVDCKNYWIKEGYDEVTAGVICNYAKAFVDDPTLNFPLQKNMSSLFDMFSYRDVLSFVSILVTRVLETTYPNVDSMFKNTQLALKTGIEQSIINADRANNPNLYENDVNVADFNSPEQANMDLISLFFEGVIKAVANTTDPTWQTPWLLPGPLTPFGIIAKLLDGSEDAEDPESSATKIQENLVDDPFKCEDET